MRDSLPSTSLLDRYMLGSMTQGGQEMMEEGGLGWSMVGRVDGGHLGGHAFEGSYLGVCQLVHINAASEFP